MLEIKAEVGATIPASSVLSNVAYRGDRLDAIRYKISELGAFRSSTIDYDDAEYFAVDPISGTLSWKKLPPPGKYDFALVVKAFDAERPELFDEILVTFAISIKLTPPPAPKIDLHQSVGDVPTLAPSDDVVTNTPSKAPTLLDVVKTEAAQMDVFPKAVFLHRVAQPLPAIRSYFLDDDFYKDSPFFHPFYEGDLLLGRGICYDLTFEERLVFYRFKTAVCYAAPQEIDECVAKFDEMSPKERALVLTAIQLWREAQINSRFVRSAQKFLEKRGDLSAGPHLTMVSAPSLYPCVQVGEQVFLPGDYATPDLQSILWRNNWPDWSRFVWKNYSRRLDELNGDEQVSLLEGFRALAMRASSALYYSQRLSSSGRRSGIYRRRRDGGTLESPYRVLRGKRGSRLRTARSRFGGNEARLGSELSRTPRGSRRTF